MNSLTPHTVQPWFRPACAAAGLAAVCLMSGCANAPKAETDQANQTALLIANFQAEVQEFKRVQSVLAAQRIASIKRLQTKVDTYRSDDKFDDRAAKLAGQDVHVRAKLFTDLQTLGDSRAKDAQDLNRTLADLDTQFAALVSPLPDISPALSNARKSLAVLGDQLSTAERIKVTASFAKEVKQAVDKNLEQITAAEAAAAGP